MMKIFVKKILLGNIIMPTTQQQAANVLAADTKKLQDDVTANSSQAIIIADATNVYKSAQAAYSAAGGNDTTFLNINPDLNKPNNAAARTTADNAATAAGINNKAARSAARAANNAARAANNAANNAAAAVNANDAVTDAANYATFLGITIMPVDPSCFNEGTKILCLNKNLQEEYLPIETLRRGDFVKSYKHGYRRIDLIGKNPMINDPKRWHACMYKMEKTESNGLLEDLIVTGGHAVLVDELGEYKEKNDELFHGETPKIDDTYLLLSAVSKDFVKQENTNLYTYYHLTLENNGNDDERFGIWANGVLTETPSKTQFTDHKYTLL
jgi:hypothetical protein